jgi:hypothetical protein
MKIGSPRSDYIAKEIDETISDSLLFLSTDNLLRGKATEDCKIVIKFIRRSFLLPVKYIMDLFENTVKPIRKFNSENRK